MSAVPVPAPARDSATETPAPPTGTCRGAAPPGPASPGPAQPGHTQPGPASFGPAHPGSSPGRLRSRSRPAGLPRARVSGGTAGLGGTGRLLRGFPGKGPGLRPELRAVAPGGRGARNKRLPGVLRGGGDSGRSLRLLPGRDRRPGCPGGGGSPRWQRLFRGGGEAALVSSRRLRPVADPPAGPVPGARVQVPGGKWCVCPQGWSWSGPCRHRSHQAGVAAPGWLCRWDPQRVPVSRRLRVPADQRHRRPGVVGAPSASETGRACFMLLGLVLRTGFILSREGMKSRM